jgi:hypothetical protein
MRDLPGSCAKSPALSRDFGEVRVSCVFRKSSLHDQADFRFDDRGRRLSTDHERDGVAHGNQPDCGSEAALRRLLLSPEPSVCSLRNRSLCHVPARAPRRVAPAEPAPIRVPAGAPAAGRVGVPIGLRTGRVASVARGCGRSCNRVQLWAGARAATRFQETAPRAPAVTTAAHPARPALTDGPRIPACLYVSGPMYWPLIGGFVAFVLLAILLGWIMDPSRRR